MEKKNQIGEHTNILEYACPREKNSDLHLRNGTMHNIQIGENREALRVDGEEGEDGEEDPESLPSRQAVLTRVMLRVTMAGLQSSLLAGGGLVGDTFCC